MIFSEIIDQALRFASQAHEGQYRVGGQTPYFSHCAAVGYILLQAGFSEEVVAAGILHDVIEDTEVTLDVIKKEFGESISQLVSQLTDSQGLSFIERKQRQIEMLKSSSPEVKAIKSADILHNLYSKVVAVRVGQDIWTGLDQTKAESIWGYEEIIKVLQTESNNFIVGLIEKYLKELKES